MSGETENISSNGVLFQASGQLEVGDSIEYYITLPTAPSPSERLRLRCVGKVTRVLSSSVEGENPHMQVAATMERYEFTRQRIAAKATA
jgi:hypothetical protein